MSRGLYITLIISASACVLAGCQLFSSGTSYYHEFENPKELQDFFRYKEGDEIIVSGHRGGRERHFPENSIESLQNVMNQMPAVFEIDPRLTKDSVIVLMHDEMLNRTTNATGKLSDFTWKELKDIRLKDAEGNITDYSIPSLEQVIRWSKGKTIINLDKKDVPSWMIVNMIKRLNAESHVMLTVHNGSQARYYYENLPGIMLSVFVRNEKEYADISLSGVPWENMIAYVGPAIDESNVEVVRNLRAKGVKCMVSYAPTFDKLQTPEERMSAYQEGLKEMPDIIESDLPAEVWSVIKTKLGK
jgi:glycerophosphoryl diester phosphodiesterase